MSAALDRIGERPKAYVIDFTNVPLIDSTAAATIAGFARKAQRQGALLYIAGATRPVRRALLLHGLRLPNVRFRSSQHEAVRAAHQARTPDTPPLRARPGVA